MDSCQYLSFVFFFFFSYLSDFGVVLLCDFDSLMVNYVKHPFVCLLATYTPFERNDFRFFPISN